MKKPLKFIENVTIQVHKKSQSLVLNHALLPFVSDLKHKVIEDGGKSYVAVKHDLDSYKKLKDCGLDVPHPFDTLYNPPKLSGIYDPMPHQLQSAKFLVDNKRSFNLSEPQTGKTYSLLMGYDFLHKFCGVRKVIIYSTLSGVESTWHQTVLDTFSDYSVGVLPNGNTRGILETFAKDLDIYITNHDTVKNKDFLKALRQRKDIDIILWDEHDVISNASTDMTKCFKNSIQLHQRVLLASGTPTGSKPTAAWSPVRIISPDNVPQYFGKFRDLVQYKVGEFTWVNRKNANEIVHKAMQPAICFLKKDVLTKMPELRHERIECKLSAEQKKMYESMRKTMLMEHESGDKILAVNAADRVIKLLQITLGAYKIGENEYQEIDCQDRIEKIIECLKTTPRKAIVFCPFRGAMTLYHREIRKHFSCSMVSGDTSSKERNIIFDNFKNAENPHVLIAHPATTSHSLSFYIADKILWVGPAQKSLNFLQANERIASASQEHPMTIFFIGATPLEWKRFDSLIAKRDDQTALLQLYQEVLKDGA